MLPSSWRRCTRTLFQGQARTRTRTYATGRGGSPESTAYCRQLVQKHDYEAFLTSYFYPRKLQPAYFAIRAFNVELATIKDQVSNAALGQIRMQFWRDTIKSVYKDQPPQHPIALALHEAKAVANLPAYHFKRIIDARDRDFENQNHMTIQSLRDYSESTSSTMFYLLLDLLGISSSSTYSHAASHLGLAHTFTTLLRGLPYHASKGHIVIPTEITARHRVNQEEVIRTGPAAAGISDAVYEFACVAKEELDTAREQFEGGIVPREALPVFLSGVPISSYLTRLEALDFDAYDRSLQVKDWKLPLRIWRHRSRQQF